MDVVADEVLLEGQFVAGANRDGWHLRGVEAGRDFQPRFADIRETNEGDACPRCGGRLRLQTAVEVGHISKLGTRYSEPLGATFLDEDGRERPIVMGSYGIGPARIAAAAIEQGADEQGISWPKAIAPFDVHLVGLGKAGSAEDNLAEGIYKDLAATGFDVLYDDRDVRAGEKLVEAELLGCPVRVVAGRRTLESGELEVQVRRGLQARSVPLQDAATALRDLWEALE